MNHPFFYMVVTLFAFTSGYWVGDNNRKEQQALEKAAREQARVKARMVCDGPAWLHVDNDSKFLCATGSMRLHKSR